MIYHQPHLWLAENKSVDQTDYIIMTSLHILCVISVGSKTSIVDDVIVTLLTFSILTK